MRLVFTLFVQRGQLQEATIFIVHSDQPFSVQGVSNGGAHATAGLAMALANKGHRVIVGAKLIDGEQDFGGVSFWDAGPSYNIEELFTRVRKLGPYKLISSSSALPLVLARGDSQCLSKILIARETSLVLSGLSASSICHIADQVVVLSDAQKDLLCSEGMPACFVHVIRDGIDTSVFTAGDPSTRDYLKLIFAGALVSRKGIDLFIDAVKQVKKRLPQVTIDVYGSADLGGEEETIDTQALEAEISGLRFLGKVRQARLASALRTAGLCVIPSRWFESFSHVAMEAQASGCPVIGFDVSSLSEVIIPGQSGIIVKEVSAKALADNLIELLEDPSRIQAMSKGALHGVRPRAGWDLMAASYEELLNVRPPSQSRISVEVEKTEIENIASNGNSTLAILSPFRQGCRLSYVCESLAAEYESENVVIFAEEIRESTEENNFEDYYTNEVVTCWRRGDPSYEALEKAMVDYEVDVLILNASASFFVLPPFLTFLDRVRARGTKVIFYTGNTFGLNEQFEQLVQRVDRVLTYSYQNRLEAIANGSSSEQTSLLPLGVPAWSPINDDAEWEQARERLGLQPSHIVIFSFGFLQQHKGMEGVIDAVYYLRKQGFNAVGIVAGKVQPDESGSAPYALQIKNYIKQLGVSDWVRFIDEALPEEDIDLLLRISDVNIVNYRSTHFEPSGVAARALASGVPLITSLAPPFWEFHDAVWRATSAFPVVVSTQILITNESVRNEVLDRARDYCDERCWAQIKNSLDVILREFSFTPSPKRDWSHLKKTPISPEPNAVQLSPIVSESRRTNMRVLFQNRPSAITHPGGDTAVMKHYAEELALRNIDVVIDLDLKENPKDYDVVHLFNFVLPEFVKHAGERAQAAGVPFVVTTLLEDVPTFHTQSHQVAQYLIEYVRRGQDRTWFQQSWPRRTMIEPAQRFDNEWTAKNASALIVNGEGEASTLRAYYGPLTNIDVVPFGVNYSFEGNAQAFIDAYGVENFILCVGRFETRKNQLMLLKALEDSDIPVVLVGGGVSYQPDYDQAVRQFRRQGPTLVLDRLSDEMLANAYKAARVHVLPSWYELPGLVSLEAAARGCNVVSTPYGTSRDYLNNFAVYCEADNELAILNAVLAAYYKPIDPRFAEVAIEYTWARSADRLETIYNKVAGRNVFGLRKIVEAESSRVVAVEEVKGEEIKETQVQRSFMDEADAAAGNGDLDGALTLLDQEETAHGPSARLFKSRGAILLAKDRVKEAAGFFAKALGVDPRDYRSLSGSGMCASIEGRNEQAYGYFVRALNIEPDHLVSIFQLVRVAYIVNQYDDLARILKTYSDNHPEDVEMRFCYAGSLYKLGKFVEAEGINRSVLAAIPDHKGGLELKIKLEEERTKKAVEIKQEFEIPRARESMDIETSIIEAEDGKKRRDFESARALCEQLLQRNDLSIDHLERVTILRAEILVLCGHSDDALKIYQEVLIKNPKSWRALCGKGAIAASRNSWREAESLFREANEILPRYDVALAGLGLCSQWAKDITNAWGWYQKALESNPENLRALMGVIELGYTLNRLEHVETAIKNYLELHPADLDLIYSLAGCYVAQERLDEAVTQIDKITLFHPHHEKALQLKQVVHEKLSQMRAS